MKELDISPNFTLEDIRKIRNYNYEMTKDMTYEERDLYYKKLTDEAMKRYEKVLAGLESNYSIVAEPPSRRISSSTGGDLIERFIIS